MQRIENVGDLVCPASYDLGEDRRAVLISVTDREDTPLKYPTIFESADVAVMPKRDLADAIGWDRAAAHAAVARVRPGLPVLEVPATASTPGWSSSRHASTASGWEEIGNDC